MTPILALSGHIFSDLFALCSASRLARLYCPLSPSLPRKLGAAMGRHSFGGFYAARPDTDLYLSEYGCRQYLVCRPSGRDDHDLFWRGTRNASPTQAPAGEIKRSLREGSG